MVTGSYRRVFLALALILLVSSLLSVGVISAQGTTVSSFDVSYGGRSYDAATNQTTFSYTVTGMGVPPDLSHFDVQIPVCDIALNVVAFSPADAVSFGVDPNSGVDGIKWDLPLLTTESRTYSITFDGNVVEGDIVVAIKDGNGVQIIIIIGPSCAVPSIDVEKFVSLDGGATWQDADDAPGPDAVTGDQASFRFVVTNDGNVELTSLSVTDSMFDLSGCAAPATLAPGGSFECTVGPFPVVDGQHTNTATANGTFESVVVSDTDNAHYFVGNRPSIHIEKFVSINGGATWQDADSAPGPEIQTTGQVLFRFVVTNDGNVPLSGVTLSDSAFATTACTIPGTLQPNASFECVVGPFPATAGQHTNTGTATGVLNSTTVTATDNANYLGFTTPAVVNGFTVTYGGRVFVNNQTTFTYIVTGTGVPPDLSHFDVEIPICSPHLRVVAYSPTEAVDFGIDPTTGVNGIKWGQPLKVNESRTYTITFEGNVVEGTVLVAVKGGNGFQTISISGPSCDVPSIDVEKFVSLDGGATWQDADAAPGPDAELGTQVSFRFVVTNDGNNDLSGISLSDSDFDLGSCTIPATLAADAFFDCVIGPFDVVAGQHSNTATATGSFAGGGVFTTDTDSAHYFGGDRPAIDIEKFVSTNGGASWVDADGATGPLVELDGEVSFKFVVTNTGNVALTGLTLSDSVYDASHCTIPALLDPGASFECVVGPFPVSEGQHTNTGTASGSANGATVSDTDNANYFGGELELPEAPIIIVIEGPVEAININVITIYGVDIELDPDDPILVNLQIGDLIHLEGERQNGVIVIVVINIIVIDVDVVIPGGGGGSGSGGSGSGSGMGMGSGSGMCC